MILEKQTESHILEEGSTQETVKMSLDLDSAQVLMQMLSKNLYSDSIGSTIRECASNALDSHRRAGSDKPIIVSFKRNDKADTYEFAVEDYEIKKNALDLSKNISIKNEIKFFEGLTTSFDLSQAQRQLYMAQQDHLQSMLNILLKRVELESLINTPLKN